MESKIFIIKVIPNASKNSIEGFQGDVLKVRIQAPPDKGKANDALIAFLAKSWKLSKSQIRIISGHTSRLKKIEITGDFKNKNIDFVSNVEF